MKILIFMYNMTKKRQSNFINFPKTLEISRINVWQSFILSKGIYKENTWIIFCQDSQSEICINPVLPFNDMFRNLASLLPVDHMC